MLRRDFLAAAMLGWAQFAIGGEARTMKTTRRVSREPGIELATEAMGSPVHGTVLLVMGATASMVWWPEAMLAALADAGYQVIRFDHRDTGASTTHAPGDVRYTVADIAADLLAILDSYDVQAAHLVGMSLGGYVSQIVALEQPDRVLSLTLIASEPLGVPYQGETMSAEMLAHFGTIAELDMTDRPAVRRFMLRIAELSAGSAVPFDPEAALRRIDAELDRTQRMQSAFNHALIGGELAPEQRATNLSLPTLIVHGTEDPVIPVAAARASAEAIPGAQLLLLEGRGHELLDLDVPTLADAILRLAAGR